MKTAPVLRHGRTDNAQQGCNMIVAFWDDISTCALDFASQTEFSDRLKFGVGWQLSRATLP